MIRDLSFDWPEGSANIRVGAIIQKKNQFLMVENLADHFFYSVGGRIHFGESMEQAITREVQEETGVLLTIDKLEFLYESFFIDDYGSTKGNENHEITFFYRMNTPSDFEPLNQNLTDTSIPERLVWVDSDTEGVFFPAFFRTELERPFNGIRHILEDYR